MMAIELNRLPIEAAGNAVGSVTVLDGDEYLRENPDIKLLMQTLARMFRAERTLNGSSDYLDVLDLGSGSGKIGLSLAKILNSNGFWCRTTSIDKVPLNAYKCKELYKTPPYGFEGRALYGDVVENFPVGMYDLIWMSQLIHWLSPVQCQRLFKKSVSSLKPKGKIAIIYGTPYNNANLRDVKGVVRPERLRGDPPLERWSDQCQTMMCWWTHQSLDLFFEELGLRDIFFYPISSPYFPTSLEITSPIYNCDTDRRECAGVIYTK